MKRIIKVIGAIVLSGALMLGVVPKMEVQAASYTVTCTTLGDSITDYATYEGKTWTSYPMYAKNYIEKNYGAKVELYNHAKGGYTADDIVLQLDNVAIIRDIQNSDIVTVFIGGNDFLYAARDALSASGINLWDVVSGKTNMSVLKKMALCSTLMSVYGDVNNKYHKKYISSLEDKITLIVGKIQDINPNCEIGIATMYYNRTFANEFVSVALNVSTSVAGMLRPAFEKSVKEMQSFFKATAEEEGRVHYVDTNELCNPIYLQLDDKGNMVDFHPNEEGQRLLANCFARDILKEISIDDIKNGIKNKVKSCSGYSFYSLNEFPYSSNNVCMAEDRIILSVNSTGIGTKLNCVSETSARTFEYYLKAAKEAGVITGVSFWDNSTSTEILLRFEGTNTNCLKACIGGNGKYITELLYLGFDAAFDKHKYYIEFNENLLSIFVDDKKIGVIDLSGVLSPVGKVSPVVFVEKADWIGRFSGRDATAIFYGMH